VVNQLLTEMDGMDSRHTIFVIAATNRPELIDPAMMRPGRLDKLLYVPLPTPEDRVAILKALATNVKLGDDVDLEAIGKSPRAEGYSGADCAALLREAGLAVLKEDIAIHISCRQDVTLLRITTSHFDIAFSSVMPSVSNKDQARYDRIRNRMARARSRPLESNEENLSAQEKPSGKETTGEVTEDTDDKMHDAEVDPKR
jgi:ribosome biogenesis ATPase